MRKIKFRAWDKILFNSITKTRMFEVYSLNLRIGSLYEETEEGHEVIHNLNDCILMQFTGLKDKQDKEIYEGDIIRVQCAGGLQKFEVIWEEENARFNRKNVPYLSGGVSSGEGTEIIGNIYEHPKLLKES